MSPRPLVAIDAVFFQMFQTGIARVWRQLLRQWLDDGFGPNLLVLDRAGTAPKFDGLRYRAVAPYNYATADADKWMLQQICDEEGVDVFASTYYTTPITTPSVFMAHDMIPELFGWDLRHPMWREKHAGLRHATALVSVSHSTKRDLLRFFPEIPADKVTVTPLAPAAEFHPRPPEEVDALRRGAGLTKPYFLTVGTRSGYKNTTLTFRALAAFPRLAEFDLLCAGHVTLEPEHQALIPGKAVAAFNLTDDELAAAYTGAVALLHPSTYEGFGLPVIEALACGCPVVTTSNGSLAEVAGPGAIFVPDDDPAAMARALDEVQDPTTRARLTEAGLAHAKNFSWAKCAAQIREVLCSAIPPVG